MIIRVPTAKSNLLKAPDKPRPMRLTRSALLFSLLFLLLASAVPADILRVTASAPIVEDVLSPGQQRRSMPWADQTATAAAGFRAFIPREGNASQEALSPAQAAARARLNARQAAREELARQIAPLPASEPAPGDVRNLTLAEFAATRPEVADAINRAIASAQETVTRTEGQNAVLQLRLDLKDLAQQVLDFGGGFAVDPASLGPEAARQRAARLAEQKAQAELIRQLLQKEALEGELFSVWVRRAVGNRERLLTALKGARKVKNEERSATNGTREWFVELRFDTDPLQNEIRREERRARSRREGLQ